MYVDLCWMIGHGTLSKVDGHPSGRKQRNFVAGSAYVLSRKALEMASCKLSGCNGGTRVQIPEGNWEDVFISDLLREVGVEAHDTRDECGAERFNPFNIYGMVNGLGVTWFREYSYNQMPGLWCCSKEPICYHGYGPTMLFELHAKVQKLKRF